MLQTFKIVSGQEQVEWETWFQMASEGARVRRQVADPCNIKPQASKLKVRKKFTHREWWQIGTEYPVN
jgi:hypothetical protein